MEQNIIYQEGNSIIHFNSMSYIVQLINFYNSFVIIDKKVYDLYPQYFKGVNGFILESVEHNKSIESYKLCIEKLINLNLDKQSTIIAIGGGIVCDFAGFVAATYKRGTKLILVPTTFLAQVDASIGGKNGLNYLSTKNMIGTIRLPDEVVINTEFLTTLPMDEIINGFAEVIKISTIYNLQLFEYLENFELPTDNEWSGSLSIKILVSESIRLKMQIVSKDTFDNGIRQILNFGHTIAHSLESVYGISHGKSVSLGISIASYISLQNKIITQTEYDRILNLLMKFRLPVKFKFSTDKLTPFIKNDKKNSNLNINEILVKGIGEYTFKSFALDDYFRYLNDLC